MHRRRHGDGGGAGRMDLPSVDRLILKGAIEYVRSVVSKPSYNPLRRLITMVSGF